MVACQLDVPWWHSKELDSVAKADVFYDAFQQSHVGRQQTCFNVSPKNLTEQPTKVFVAWVRQETP